jgi:hypothetical protein
MLFNQTNQKGHTRALKERVSGTVTWRSRLAAAVSVIVLLHSAVGNASGPAGLYVDRIRLACSFSVSIGTISKIDPASFCEFARSAVQQLAAGRLEGPVKSFRGGPSPSIRRPP